MRRYFLRGISHVLRCHLGNTARNQVFDDVQFAGVDDTREVMVTSAEMARLVRACDHFGYDALRLGIPLSLQTSADRGTLFHGNTSNRGKAPGLRVRQLRIWEDDSVYSGELYLDDQKTTSRPRTVRLTDSLCRELLPHVIGKAADDFVIPMLYSQVDVQWKRVRKEAGLPTLRFKDLRAQFSIAAERAGIPLAVTSKAMGHKAETMTASYQRHRAHMTDDQASAVEKELGLAAKPSLHSSLHKARQTRKNGPTEPREALRQPRRVPLMGQLSNQFRKDLGRLAELEPILPVTLLEPCKHFLAAYYKR